MPTYSLECCSDSKPHRFDQFMTFSEFDYCKGQVKCPECGLPTRILIPEEPVHSHCVNQNTVGKLAENNSKKLGKYGVEDASIEEAKKRKPIKTRAKKWYGEMEKSDAAKIFNETNKEAKQKKIEKYVNTGEI